MKNKRSFLLLVLLTILFAGCRKKSVTLSFSSFEGGGPSFSITIEDESVVSVERTRKYYDANHERLKGAGYDVVFTFTGLKPGTTPITIASRSPTDGRETEHHYIVTVDDKLDVKVETEGSTSD